MTINSNQALDGAGKRWRLRRLADADGFFSMVAIDQRPPLFALLAGGLGCRPEELPYSEIVAAKRLLASAFASQASAMLVDPNWGYVGAADVLDPSRGLLLTLEDHRTTPDRRSRCIEQWSVEKIRAIGGDAVKLLAWYHPGAEAGVREHQQAFVQQVGEECARCELPFVLELLLYPLDAAGATGAARRAADYLEDPAKQSELVLASVEHFAQPRYGVDLFKLESPLPARAVPASGGEGSEAWASTFTALGRACAGRPWVMLSAGAPPADFEAVVGYAARAGAAGFLAGRALWADALVRWPDREAARAQLMSVSRERLRRLQRLMREEGRPWAPSPWAPGVTADGQLAQRR